MATSEGLRKAYFSNRYVFIVRTEIRSDEVEWDRLKSALIALAGEWRGQGEVDKDIVNDLVVLSTIVRGVADRLQETDATAAFEFNERAIEIDALVLDALAP